MGKQLKKQKTGKRTIEEKPLVPKRFETPVLIALVLVLLIVFLHEAIFENKVFISSDLSASKNLQTFVDQAKKQNVFPLWIPYMFSGMPSFASLLTAGDQWYDIVGTVFGWIDHAGAVLLINQDVGWVTIYYFIFGVGMFVLLRRLGLNKFASFFGATAAVFSTFIIIWIMVGHNTKIAAMAFLPFIIALVIELTQRFRWSYLLGLIVALHLQFASSHIQMIFYSYLAIGIYLVSLFVRNLIKKEKVVGTIRSGALLIVASAIAFLMSADVYFSTYEYSKYSIRGASPIVRTSQDKAQTGGGLDYEYATNWSFNPEEMVTFFIPSFYGFGDFWYQGPLTNNQGQQINTYFGPMTFTDAPFYMGVVVLLLAVIGFVKNRRNPFVISSLVVIIVALFISFGRELPLIYDLMFSYFPYFNKFRSPSMILVLVQIFVPILAAFGVDAVVKARENSDTAFTKKMLIWTGAFAGLMVLVLLLQGSLQDFYNGVIQSSQKFRNVPDAVSSFLFDNMISDLYISLLICVLSAGTIYLYLQRRITSVVFGVVLTAILLFDLWRVDYKPMELHARKIQEEQFSTPDYVQFIKRDNGLYRVLQLQDGQTMTSDDLAYCLLQDASGYSGAKLRIYQDMIDVDGLTNPNIMRLLGVKYIITDKPDPGLGKIVFTGSRIVEENSNALPRAFFVDGYKVASGLEILSSLKTGAFDASKIVYFENDPNLKIDAADSSTKVTFTDYQIQAMKMHVEASGNNLLLLSEVYYPAGWNAFIDGNRTQIYKADYFLRAILVPKGVHDIELKFEPRIYSIGKDLSLATNGVVLLLLVGMAAGWAVRRSKSKKQETQASNDASV
ncbi:MAG: YfhO family protein [Candidatus Kryptoniota bacterium]